MLYYVIYIKYLKIVELGVYLNRNKLILWVIIRRFLTFHDQEEQLATAE